MTSIRSADLTLRKQSNSEGPTSRGKPARRGLPAPRTSRRLCGHPVLAGLVSAPVVFSFCQDPRDRADPDGRPHSAAKPRSRQAAGRGRRLRWPASSAPPGRRVRVGLERSRVIHDCENRRGAYRCVLVPRALCGLAVAAWTVGKTPRCWRSPVMCSPWSTCGETAARRRNPPRSLARRPVPISTARPGASQWLTLDRSMTSRLEPGRSRPRSCSRSAGAQARSSSPLSSATVMPPAAGVERARPGAVVVAGSVMRLLSG